MALRIFPVADVPGRRTVFSDDWGAPRGSHTHQGNDIFATDGKAKWDLGGSPVLAVDDGTLQDASNPAGGNALWTTHADGSAAYYAHLDAFEGKVPRNVVAGEVIGYVGRTGSACYVKAPSGECLEGYYHLHFGWKPNGTRGDWVDPFPLLSAPGVQHVTSTAEEAGITSWKLVAVSGLALLVVGAGFWAALKYGGRAASSRSASGRGASFGGSSRRLRVA